MSGDSIETRNRKRLIREGVNEGGEDLRDQLNRIERMLKWLVFDSKLCDEVAWIISEERSDKYNDVRNRLPDISDILEET